MIVDIRAVNHLAYCIACLHNYCINERLNGHGELSDPIAQLGIQGRHNGQALADLSAEVQAEDVAIASDFVGVSHLREKMVQRVRVLQMTRH